MAASVSPALFAQGEKNVVGAVSLHVRWRRVPLANGNYKRRECERMLVRKMRHWVRRRKTGYLFFMGLTPGFKVGVIVFRNLG